MSNRSFIMGWESACRRMRAHLCFLAKARMGVLFLMFLAAFSARSHGINSPVGRGTAPASSVGSGRVPEGIYRGGLVRSPDPIDSSGNLVVTGNVRGGRHFRGIVPYQSRYSFEADLPSSSLDSFLRYSAGSEDIGGASTYGTQPYYSGTKTVTTAGPSDRVIFRPEGTRIDYRASSKSVLLPPSLEQVPVREYEYVVAPYTSIKLRPLSMSPAELEQVILEDIETLGPGTISENKKLAEERHQPRIEPLLQDLRTVSDKAAELRRSLLVEDELLQLPTKTEPGSLKGLKKDEEQQDKLKTEALESTASGMGEEVSQEQEDVFGVPDAQVDVYEQMKWQINNIQRVLEQPTSVKQTKKVKAADKARKDDEEEFLFMTAKAQEEMRDTSAKEEKKRGPVSSQEKGSLLEELSERESEAKGVDLGSRDDVAARAREILGEYKTFASFAEDKFNRHMWAAEEYLKRGRFYRAADAYTLASIYKPDDPLAYAGKSHALFAAGEYMSSALFLARALEIFPQYAQFKIDLVAMVGDKDKLESRIANVEEWLDESGAAELQFLLGYVYYQMGRQTEAEKMIYAAFERMPESPAVVALKNAISASAAE